MNGSHVCNGGHGCAGAECACPCHFSTPTCPECGLEHGPGPCCDDKLEAQRDEDDEAGRPALRSPVDDEADAPDEAPRLDPRVW